MAQGDAGGRDHAGSPDVHTFRQRLGERHRADGVLDDDAAARADVVFNLTRLQARLSADFDAVHRSRGWTWSGFRIMNVLWAVGSVDMRDLARLAGASRAAVSSVLNTLERDGLVIRERDGRDRRLVMVRLTERGRHDLEEGMRAQADRERLWFAELDRRELEQLSGLLAAIADQPVNGRPEK